MNLYSVEWDFTSSARILKSELEWGITDKACEDRKLTPTHVKAENFSEAIRIAQKYETSNVTINEVQIKAWDVKIF